MAASKAEYREVLTPLTADQAFASQRRGAGDLLLESAMPLGDYGQRSLLLFSGGTYACSRGNQITVVRDGRLAEITGDPFTVLGELLQEFQCQRPTAGAPLCGAAAGYLGYDLCHFVEDLPKTVQDDLQTPDLWFHFCPVVVTFDHQAGRCFVGWTERGQGRETEFAHRVAERLKTGGAEGPAAIGPAVTPRGPVKSNFTREEYVRAVRRAQEYILAGDIYQVNLSQRFSAPFAGDPWELYRRLRRVNPAPFAAYLHCGDHHVLSASPERFLWLDPQSRRMHTRPIKGTRPRSPDPETDRLNAQELLRSEKDRAEHLMIVDLERNDLGRVAELGSVRVKEMAALESFQTVFHLTSTVEATLRADCDRLDLLRATFPGGSITGAPKIRAMEIIDELEPTRRGVYTGAIGYLGFDGGMDLNIAIRTMVVKEAAVYFQAGGGIVADSDPGSEYQETLDKSRALVEALDRGGQPSASRAKASREGRS